MDRSNIGNAKIAGMEDALSLSDTGYSLAINLFQVSYIVFSVPSGMILTRIRPSIYVPTIIFLWGIVVAAKAAITTPAQLWGLRFALGALEAGFPPTVFHIFGMWYKKSEQTKRFLVFWLAGILGSAFGGILAGAITSGLDGTHGIPKDPSIMNSRHRKLMAMVVLVGRGDNVRLRFAFAISPSRLPGNMFQIHS
jgi:MFS family permease